MNKESIRKEIIVQRKNLKQSQKLNWDFAINQALNNFIEDFGIKSVLGFYPKNDEVNLVPFLEYLIGNNIELFLPKINGDELEIYRILDLEHLQSNEFGILEPTIRNELVTNYNFDLVAVPGVAFNLKNGHRIGYGKGFYDIFLKKCTALKVGIAYEMQTLNTWQNEQYDVAVDFIITESGSYKI